MKIKIFLTISLMMVFGYSPEASAVKYLSDSTVKSEFKNVAIRDCRKIDTLKVPLITWGADMVTIHANGSNLKTQENSEFHKRNLDIKLYREDNFTKQLKAYLNCETPFLRATLGMANLVIDVTETDKRTRMQAIYQHSWSAGGDAIVVKSGIKSPKDLKGKTIALQKNGPHVDYLMTILKDAGLKPSDVTIKWTKDLVGFDGSTPSVAIQNDANIDAAMVIIPDGLALTSDGTVGTGSEDSVKGAKILISTRSANRVISDVYFVRNDYLQANKTQIENFVRALLVSEEAVRKMMNKKSSEKNKLVKASAKILLDSSGATEDAKALWADAETTGWAGNVKFFTDSNYPRNYDRIISDVQNSLVSLGQISSQKKLGKASWDWDSLKPGSVSIRAEATKFNHAAVTQAITRQQVQGTIGENTLFEFEINFKPNQESFPTELYQKQFARVVDLASTYSGAVITIEGHSDPLGYLKSKKAGESQIMLNMKVQSARNLSVSRSQSVRKNIINMASQKSIFLDASQFVVIGMGFQDPKTGICGSDPCAPKSESEWLSNMRVVFRIVNVEAEANAFSPL